MSNWHFLYEVSSVQEELIVCKEFSATSHFLYPAFRIHSSLKMVLQSVYLGCATQAMPFFFLQANTWFYLYVRGVWWAIFKADQWTEWGGRASAIHDILSSLSEHCVPLPTRHRCLCYGTPLLPHSFFPWGSLSPCGCPVHFWSPLAVSQPPEDGPLTATAHRVLLGSSKLNPSKPRWLLANTALSSWAYGLRKQHCQGEGLHVSVYSRCWFQREEV